MNRIIFLTPFEADGTYLISSHDLIKLNLQLTICFAVLKRIHVDVIYCKITHLATSNLVLNMLVLPVITILHLIVILILILIHILN